MATSPEQEPWALAKDEAQADRLDAVLYQSADALRVLALVLHPFMPQSMSALWGALGQTGQPGDRPLLDVAVAGGLEPGTAVLELPPLFPGSNRTNPRERRTRRPPRAHSSAR